MLPNPFPVPAGSHVFRVHPTGPQTLIVPRVLTGTTTFITSSIFPWTVTCGPDAAVDVGSTTYQNSYAQVLTTHLAPGQSIVLTPMSGRTIRVFKDGVLAGTLNHQVSAEGWLARSNAHVAPMKPPFIQ